MTTRRLILGLAVSSVALLLVARAATSMFPLRVHAQEFSAEPIQVLQGGENLLHRAALVYPRRAMERRVEGDIVLEVSTDEQGQVSDARVLSGPEELRRSCLESVLEWRFQPSKVAAAGTQVMIHFQLPKQGTSSEVVLPAAPEENEDRVVRQFVMSDPEGAAVAEQQVKELEERMQRAGATAEERASAEKVLLDKLSARLAARTLEREADGLKVKIADAGTTPEERARLTKELAEREAERSKVREEQVWFAVSGDEAPVSGKLTAIRTERVSQATLAALSPRLGVHLGDMIDAESAKRLRETVRQTLGEQFRARFNESAEDGVELVIVGP